jgi:hypothetical protein
MRLSHHNNSTNWRRNTADEETRNETGNWQEPQRPRSHGVAKCTKHLVVPGAPTQPMADGDEKQRANAEYRGRPSEATDCSPHRAYDTHQRQPKAHDQRRADRDRDCLRGSCGLVSDSSAEEGAFRDGRHDPSAKSTPRPVIAKSLSRPRRSAILSSQLQPAQTVEQRNAHLIAPPESRPTLPEGRSNRQLSHRAGQSGSD